MGISLGVYDNTLQFKEGKDNANADALSRLPLPTSNKDPPRPAEVIHLLEYLATSPVSSARFLFVLVMIQFYPEVGGEISQDGLLQDHVRRNNFACIQGGGMT